MIRYYKLFDMLNRREMKISDLRKILSSATVAKLKKGEYISGEALEKICLFLNCQPGDIMEIVTITEEIEIETNKKIKFIEKDTSPEESGYEIFTEKTAEIEENGRTITSQLLEPPQ